MRKMDVLNKVMAAKWNSPSSGFGAGINTTKIEADNSVSRKNSSKPSHTMLPVSNKSLWIDGKYEEYRLSLLGRIPQAFPLLCNSIDCPVDVQIVDVVEEAQLKGFLPSDASAPLRLSPPHSISSAPDQLVGPRPCKVTLSLHGLKISDASKNDGGGEVRHRQPLHTILAAVSFRSQRRFFIAVAVDAESSGRRISGVGGVDPVSPEEDVMASCLVFQCSSSEEAAKFNNDVRTIFSTATPPSDTGDGF